MIDRNGNESELEKNFQNVLKSLSYFDNHSLFPNS